MTRIARMTNAHTLCDYDFMRAARRLGCWRGMARHSRILPVLRGRLFAGHALSHVLHWRPAPVCSASLRSTGLVGFTLVAGIGMGCSARS